jgi:putative SOS response-associated peptidase YedK
MCGRYTLTLPGNMLVDWFDFDPSGLDLEPQYNIAPTSRVLTLTGPGDHLQGRLMRWGLIPFFSKEPRTKYNMINARAETIAENNAYKGPFQRRRCLIPADSFYEWKKLDGKRKQPMRIMLKSGEPFAFAGIWEAWQDKNNPAAEPILSCSIITTSANSLVEPIHDRMPVILPPDLYPAWTDPANQDAAALRELLLPYDPGLMQAYPVSSLVNSVRNQGPELLQPAGPEYHPSP